MGKRCVDARKVAPVVNDVNVKWMNKRYKRLELNFEDRPDGDTIRVFVTDGLKPVCYVELSKCTLRKMPGV